jgi:restriction endonuclease Mrr
MSATYSAEIPTYNELLWPTLTAVRGLGHTAKLEEINERVIESQGFTDEQMSVLHKNGPRSEIEYRLAWARTYLKGMEALVNPSRGTLGDHPTWESPNGGRSRTQVEELPRSTCRGA